MDDDSLIDDLKDAITDIISEEYYHRTGGETRHLLEGIEIVLGAIVTAFLIPYLKKLAELTAEDTYNKLKATKLKTVSDTTTQDKTEPHKNAITMIKKASLENRAIATKIAAESLRIEMQKYNFSNEAQSSTLKKISSYLKTLQSEDYSMNMPEHYRVDQELATIVFKKFMRHRYSIGKNGLSPVEQSILSFALQHLEESLSRDHLALTTPYIHSLADMFRHAKQMYDESELGSWSFAGFWAISDLGVSVSERNERCFFARLYFKSQIMTALMLPTQGNLDSFVALYLKFLIKNELGNYIKTSLDSERSQHEKQIKSVRLSPTINDWLLRIAELSPLIDVQFLIYRCLIALVKQGHIDENELNKYNGMDLKTCRENEKRLDELSAYTVSHAISQYKDNPNACIRYIFQILEIAKNKGPRVAKRQIRYDFARLMIPQFLMDDACKQFDL
ncbi:MAG: hypothetical protein K8R53_05095 [Bacteroidales bacterium]|nr:hypothetical protein [Bacteroidales bacterium]